MAHWAQIDENNIVLQVVVTNNDDPNGDEGYQWLIDHLGGRWVQTSYNNNFRVRFASIGFWYNEDLDAFVPTKDFESWILDEQTADWVPPTPKPREDRFYFWDEETVSWKLPEKPFPSWVLVDDMWTPPVPYPQDGNRYIWNEDNQSWEQIELATPNS